MTLTKPTKRKLSHQEIKRGGHHHRKDPKYHQPYWPYLPLLAIIIAGFFINGIWMKTGVLDYAVNTTANGLLSSTNYERSNNGLSSLTLNNQLSQAAEAKAIDMVNRNYWSHTTPDGQEPWVFIANTGYKYQTAGENLAYGFPTSSDTVLAWMNSPGHRANILNSTYKEVGFGMANSADYNSSGNQTVVVAMYASPSATLVADSTSQQPPVAGTPQNTTPVKPIEEVTTGLNPAFQPDTVAANEEENAAKQTLAAAGSPKSVSRVQVAFTGINTWSVAAISLLLVALLSMLVFRHGIAWKKTLIHGEEFILHHKLLDVAVVSTIVLCVLLVQSVGFIQ